MDLRSALFDAVVKGDEAVVVHLLNLGATLMVNDEQGLTALHWCASSPEGEKLVPFLISKGANIDARDNIGQLPLHIHTARGRVYGVACLLHNGADTNGQTTDSGITPLHVAAMHQQHEIGKLLLAYGADPSILTFVGESAADLGLNQQVS